MLALVHPAGAGRRKKLEAAARIWARREFTDEEQHVQRENQAQSDLEAQLDALALVPDAPVDIRESLDTFYLFPENLPAWHLFLSVQTEWRGPAERAGLDKPAVLAVIGQRREWRKRRRDMFAAIQIMERAALDEWRAQRPSQPS